MLNGACERFTPAFARCRFDPRGSGEVHYGDVIAACKSLPEPDVAPAQLSLEWSSRVERAVRQAFHDVVSGGRASSLLSVFRAADTNGSGTLSASEFQSALSRAGLQLRSSEVRRIIHKFDRNKDGSVDWNEFLAFVNAGDSAHPGGGGWTSDVVSSDAGDRSSSGVTTAKAHGPDRAAGGKDDDDGGSGSGGITMVVPSDAVSSCRLCRELRLLRASHLHRLCVELLGAAASNAAVIDGSAELVSFLRSRFTVIDRNRLGVVALADVSGACHAVVAAASCLTLLLIVWCRFSVCALNFCRPPALCPNCRSQSCWVS